jgi:hypothetical protein
MGMCPDMLCSGAMGGLIVWGAACVVLAALCGCERAPQWVLWSDNDDGYSRAQSEHVALTDCQAAAKAIPPGRSTKCLPMGVKP